MDITGWTLQDRVGNVYEFPGPSVLNVSENDIVLRRHMILRASIVF
jgi:hypothetical protein